MHSGIRIGLSFCILLSLLMLVVTLTPFVSWAAGQMAVDWYEGDADVLVVLGGSMLVDGPGPQATLGYDSYLRSVYANWVMQRFHYRYVVVSGSLGLAGTMARFLQARGIRPEQILQERAARTTFENAEFVKHILEHQRGLPAHPKIAILTSDYHTRRARWVFRHSGMPVRAIPVPDLIKRGQYMTQRWDAFLELVDELVKDGYYAVTGKA